MVRNVCFSPNAVITPSFIIAQDLVTVNVNCFKHGNFTAWYISELRHLPRIRICTTLPHTNAQIGSVTKVTRSHVDWLYCLETQQRAAWEKKESCRRTIISMVLTSYCSWFAMDCVIVVVRLLKSVELNVTWWRQIRRSEGPQLFGMREVVLDAASKILAVVNVECHHDARPTRNTVYIRRFVYLR